MLFNFLLIVTYLLSKLFPLQEDTFVFSSFKGKYSDSPRKISEYIHETEPRIRLVWLLSDVDNPDVPDYVIKIPIHSLKRAWYESVGGTQIDNAFSGKGSACSGHSHAIRIKLLVFLKSRKSQRHYSTWHGTPLKHIGADGDASIDSFICPSHFEYLLGNKFLCDVMQRICYDKVKTVLIGSPKNSQLNNSIAENNKIKLGLPVDKKIILFAPTFRNNSNNLMDTNITKSGIDQINQMDFDVLFETLSKKFGGDWIFVARFHYFVEKEIDWESLNLKYPGKIINGNLHDDIVDYLECTDVLVTDASSSMFDFAETGRPCFLFFPDFEHYKNIERGLYFDIEELPFSLSITFDDFINAVNFFDEEIYRNNTKLLLKDIGSVDDAQSTKKVAEYILSFMNRVN